MTDDTTKTEILLDAHRAHARRLETMEELDQKRVYYFDLWCWDDDNPTYKALSEIYEEEMERRRRPDSFQSVFMPLIKRVMPSVIAKKLVGAQPMPAPAAQVHTLRYRYGETDEEEDAEV